MGPSRSFSSSARMAASAFPALAGSTPLSTIMQPEAAVMRLAQ